MSKPKKSGPAILMDWMIVITFITAIVCFILYYGNIYKSGIVLWIGIVAFVIVYQMKTRLIMGDFVTSIKHRISYKQRWFKERAFESRLYEFLRVKKWKGKAPTYNPELFVLKDHSLEEIADTMSKVEIDHWVNELISLSTLLFAIPWGAFWAFFTAAVAAMIFDAQFIAIQRYNRPRIAKILEKREAKAKKIKTV